ncbi:hypothetical protein [Paenibacillus dendritiformis]|uniref:hypothetical protein n=1 Tax=Paenibacillus dendritiformis TaxID=130049 RepID=UPI0015EB4651|nr:hypothetical protein [Paenibacillus dendritiformis]
MTCKRKRSMTAVLIVLITLLWAAVLHAEPASASDVSAVSINAFLAPDRTL